MKSMKKKGQISASIWALVGIAVAFVVVTLVLAFGSMILSDTKADMVTDSQAYNTTIKGEEAVGKFGGKLPLIATVIVAVIIIGLLIVGFAGFMSGRTRQ